MLALLRWASERYVAPLSTVIDRSHPPRVAGLEKDLPEPEAVSPRATAEAALSGLLRPGTVTWLRPLPGREAQECVAAVDACLAAGRRALVLVPEAEPVPATARAVLDGFGSPAVWFAGQDPRERYRTWLQIRGGLPEVVVGTRPAIFAPLPDLGLIWVSREVHPAHQEDRAPYYHARDVAVARARLHDAACVLAAYCPSVETAAAVSRGEVAVARPGRGVERRAAPLVETSAPEAEDRSARLGALLKRAGSAALIVSRRGYGVARVCRACGEPAACAACGGPIVVEEGRAACRVCGLPGECASCGGRSFGVERGGTERVAEWAGRIAGLPVRMADEEGVAPAAGSVLVGTAAAVKDFGPVSVDLVAILDPDRALARPGLHAGERALATWMEAAAWAGPRDRGGRVLVQTRRPGHPAVQGLVRWEPVPYLLAEAARRTEAGFSPGHPVFRVSGGAAEEGLRRLGPEVVEHLLATAAPAGTVCLVTVRPERLSDFGRTVRAMAARGDVERVQVALA